MKRLPEVIDGPVELDEVLTRPSNQLIAYMQELRGPLMVLGAGGKMGPGLCVQARRAADVSNPDLVILAVSRFSNPDGRSWLEAHGVRTIASDLSDREAVEKLPDASHIIYLVGKKFGTSDQPELTWVINTLVPSWISERYKGVPTVVLSTGNVYPLTSAESGGSAETDETDPVGEYAFACLARERLFSHFARKNGTPTVILRLNYALDLRYGVLLDLARRIQTEEHMELRMNHLNCIWQGDANDRIIRSLILAAVPVEILNLTGPVTPCKYLVEMLARNMSKDVVIQESPFETSLLSNPDKANRLLGLPTVPIETMIRWTAHWAQQNYPTLNKPTHFETREGTF